MTFSGEDNRAQLRARVSAELMAQVELCADQYNKSKSQVIREAVISYLPSEDILGPDNPKLRNTSAFLLERADERGRVQSSEVISDLAQKLSIKGKYVKSSRLEPLKRGGWIRPNHHYIEVKE